MSTGDVFPPGFDHELKFGCCQGAWDKIYMNQTSSVDLIRSLHHRPEIKMSLGRGIGRGRGVVSMYSWPGNHSRILDKSMGLKHHTPETTSSHKSPEQDTEMFEESPEKSASCICSRPKAMIICRSCGHTFVGRVRMHCPVHPGTILLMDVEACPSCKSFHLKELSEVLSPEKSFTRDA